MGKKIKILLLLMFVASLPALAIEKSAKIKRVWIEHDVTLNNKKAVKFHCDFDVNGMNGLTGYMSIWIKGPSGDWHKVNASNVSNKGIPYFKWNYKPGHDNATYSDLWYAPYIDKLNLLPGKNTYQAVICIHDNDGIVLAQANPIEFTGTGAVASNNSSYTPSQSPAQQNNNTEKEWREDLGYGGFVIVKQYANGTQFRTRYRLCPNCRGGGMCAACIGTGYCGICQGRGGIISAGYGNYYPCAMCMQTGLCQQCKGSRKCMCTTLGNYPGYVIGGTSTIYPDGSTVSNKADYNNSSSSSSSSSKSNSSSSRAGCTKCGGTGVNPTQSSGGGLQSWVAYYNTSGNKCPYCANYNSHFHEKCPRCNVPTR